MAARGESDVRARRQIGSSATYKHSPTTSPSSSPPTSPLRPSTRSLNSSCASLFRSPLSLQKKNMYRGSFAPPPAQSPPLHHPVPQHVSTVPMMRSPPPPSQQTPNAGYGGGGNPYQPSPAQGGAGNYAPSFGGFMNDGTAQMGLQVGKSAMMAGQEYVEQNVRIPGNSVLIDAYLLLKIISSIAMFPYRL